MRVYVAFRRHHIKRHFQASVWIVFEKIWLTLINWKRLLQMGFWKTVLAVFVGVLLYGVVDNIVMAISAELLAR